MKLLLPYTFSFYPVFLHFYSQTLTIYTYPATAMDTEQFIEDGYGCPFFKPREGE